MLPWSVWDDSSSSNFSRLRKSCLVWDALPKTMHCWPSFARLNVSYYSTQFIYNRSICVLSFLKNYGFVLIVRMTLAIAVKSANIVIRVNYEQYFNSLCNSTYSCCNSNLILMILSDSRRPSLWYEDIIRRYKRMNEDSMRSAKSNEDWIRRSRCSTKIE